MSPCSIWREGDAQAPVVMEIRGQQNAINEARRLAPKLKCRLVVHRLGVGTVAVIDADGTEGGR